MRIVTGNQQYEIPILTASQQFAIQRAGGYRKFIELTTSKRWAMARVNWQTRGQIPAYIGRSSWRANCPFCTESVVAEPGQPFFCPNCLMLQNGGLAMETVFPKERAEIERLLLLRPNPENRNWLPGERIGHLIIENVEHGILEY